MKTLYLIRHGKSSWDNPGLADFDRPLATRGKMDGPRMGAYLAEQSAKPDLLLSSPANRAYSTAKLIADAVGYEGSRIATDRKIYHADVYELRNIVKDIDDKYKTVMLFGHNPGFTEFVNFLTGLNISNLPTTGIACIDFHVDSWSEVRRHAGECRYMKFPKNLR